MYKLRFGIFPITYNALIMPQSKLIDIANNKLVMKVPITTPFIIFSVVNLKFSI
jgi:hypothetical protein